ncbi:unnamed protein product [Caenorhabditis bovis]|uniref:C6 domain-containing protein n=1 Tax=Caenorhabditis bovis TaxID=2654633 RepID=A0A8S1FC51_9PELO|nr:unnamed protein product [Caenorhabditis bovis]
MGGAVANYSAHQNYTINWSKNCVRSITKTMDVRRFLIPSILLIVPVDVCFASSGTTPVMGCPCSVDSVALLYSPGTVPGLPTSVEPIATPTFDEKECPISLDIMCTPPPGRTVYMNFQDFIGGVIQTNMVTLTCINGEFIHSDPVFGEK